MELISIKERIISLLKSKPELRDSDNALIAKVWYYEIGKDIDKTLDFLNAVANGRVTNPESIRRCRQNLQQHREELRGPKWHKEKKTKGGQFHVKEQLKEMK